MEADFKAYFAGIDLKKGSREGLHYEQKTTPDLLWCVAQAVLAITNGDPQRVFSDKDDIRSSPIFATLMQEYFSKPPQAKAENEYNKLSGYQLGLLAYGGVLEEVSAKPRRYRVRQQAMLAYIAQNDFSALQWLSEYTEKFIYDNGLQEVFERYRRQPTQDAYERAKEAYWQWARVHTAVRGTDRRHTYRVFNKMFNVYCHRHTIPGQQGSNVMSSSCSYELLIYKRKNFRDEGKPSNLT